MSQPIASKNLYELLGNDPELDPDRAEPKPPTKAIDKPLPRTAKRDAPDSRARGGGGGGGRGGRQENFSGNDGAFRDRGAGSYNNRNRYADDGLRQDRHANHIKDTEPRGRGRGRGGGGRGRGGPRDDRHSKTGVSGDSKQAAHGWGGKSGGDEWDDEKAGEAIAKADEGGEFTPAPFEGDGPGEVGEPITDDAVAAEAEEKTKSYDDYLAERTERSMALGPQLTARKANEGNAKKFPTGKEVSHEGNEDFMAGTGGKAKRVREKKERSVLELDDTRLRDAPRETSGRGRGGFRGGRGEGRGRGRGDGPGRGRGAGRGGGGGRGGRGGGGGGGGSGPNFSDPSSFPSLGGS